jgi:radical SAM-linked protein
MRHRLRIRFRKEEDLRLISHRDLARLWERIFRRAGLQLAMSEGFHPKAKLSFPSALSLGVAGIDEVLEVELNEECADESVRERLAREAPAGLTIDRIERLPPGARKAQVSHLTYEVPVPADRLQIVAQSIAALLERPEVWIERPERPARLDVRANLDHLALEDGRLVMRFRAAREAAARPRDVLQLLGLGDIETSGVFLTRTRVELT